MIYTIKNDGISMKVTDFGCRIMELWVKDREGREANVVLGAETEEEYIRYKGERFLGATIGRYGNRIAGGRFTLDGKTYQLPLNNGVNSLHGGFKGFDMVFWKVDEVRQDGIVFSYLSPDGEEGYPGNLSVRMSYTLKDNSLVIEYSAQTDAPTIVNLTHHSFFNLHGAGVGNVNDHLLTICADAYTPVDETLIPTGEIEPVEGTPFDFREPTEIGSRLGQKDVQLERGGGYDHNWVLNKPSSGALSKAAELFDPSTGRRMEVLTTEPGMQFYGGNYFEDKYCTLALETQHFPDSPNQPQFPSTVLRPGETYRQTCIYRFSTI